MTVALVILGAVVGVETIGLGVLGGLWLGGRRRQRRLRAEIAALRAPADVRRPRRLVPTGREVVKGVWETANLVIERGIGGALRTSIEDLAEWAQVERPDLVRLAGADGSVAILFSDIEGSTALNENLGDKQWVRLLERHDRLLRARIERERGHVVKTQGDGFMVAFSRPEEAARCAVAVQRSLEKGNRLGRTPILVRIGIHQGDVVHRSGDIFGRNVAHAARVAALAEGGEILVSEPVADSLTETGGFTLCDPRTVELKGLTGEYVVLGVDWQPPG